MKVAFIVSKFPCYDEAFILRELYAFSKQADPFIFSLRGCDENVIHDQARELLARTFYVPYFSWGVFAVNLKMFFAAPGRYLRSLLGLIAGNFKSPAFLIKNLAFFPKSIYLASLVKEKGIVHLHAYWATYPASAALVISQMTGIPFSFTGHAHDIYLDTTYLKEKITRAKFVSTCTGENKAYLERIAGGYPAEKILKNYHGLPLDEFEVPVKERNEVFQILSVGTLRPHKGFGYLLEALHLLKKKGLRFHCTIVGGGPLEWDLGRQRERLGLDRELTMTGVLKQHEILPYYKKADLLVLMAQPEWHWGIPNVLIEALAAKTPVITTRFGSVEELVKDGKTGLMVPPKNPEALALAIETLYQKESVRRDLAEHGHDFVLRHFDLRRNIGSLMAGFCS